jgi:hypothetical protein
MKDTPERKGDRYSAVTQYSLARILAVSAATAVPMGVLAWVVAPSLRDQLGGDDPFAEALLICITAGLIWQFALVLILIRRELGGLEWTRVRDALWLLPPRDPRSGRVSGKVWWWALLFVVLVAVWSTVPSIPGSSPRDFADFLDSDRGEDFFRGAWAGSQWSSSSQSSTPCSARSSSSGAYCCHECSASSEVGLGRQRRPVRRLPPAPAVGHSDNPGRGHLP